MLIKANEKVKESREKMRDGIGTIHIEKFAPKEGLPTHYRFFAEMIIEPGFSIGKHEHKGESEIYYILEGTATVDDNGTETICQAGDVSICYDGCYHAVKNNADTTLRILASIATNE